MNPYHDPKTGRFTTAGAVGAGLPGQAGLVRVIKGPGVKNTIPTGKGPNWKKHKGGEMSKVLRGSVRTLHQQEQNRLYRMGGNGAGQRLISRNLRKGGEKRAADAQANWEKAGRPKSDTKISDVLRGTLRQLAQSDARRLRAINNALKESKAADIKLKELQNKIDKGRNSKRRKLPPSK